MSVTQKTRLFAIESEQALLGAMLVGGVSPKQVSSLDAEHFADPRNVVLYRHLRDKGIAGADTVDVAAALQGQVEGLDLDYVHALAIAGGSAVSAGRYAGHIKAAAAERALLSALEDAREAAESEGELADRLDQIGSLIAGLQKRQVRRIPMLMADKLGDRLEHYTDLAEGKIDPAWQTGLSDLDRLLSGGLRPGKVYVIAARPKVGKSALAQQIAMALARVGLAGLILSQEMEAGELIDRAVCSLGRVAYAGLLTGQMEQREWERLTEGAEEVKNLPLWVDDEPALRLSDIRTKARLVPGLKLLVLDYLQLCSGSNSKAGTNRNSEIEEISRGVKALAKDLGIAVLLLSQLNREVEKRSSKRPMLADLRDSGSIEQDADAVLMLWPVRDATASTPRLVGCTVEANRCGPTGAFAMEFYGQHQRFSESSESVFDGPQQGRAQKHYGGISE